MGIARLQKHRAGIADLHQQDEDRERPRVGELGREPVLEIGLHRRS